MKINRTDNAVRNIVFGTFLKLYQIIIPFIMRTVMLYVLGIQYLGLNSLFTSVLEVLNLAELGVGSAMVFSMYKPIAMDDSKKICALMQLYKIYYRVIGLIIAVASVALTPFLRVIVTGDIPNGINIYILYYLNLGATVFTYWLFSYKNSLLIAHQRTDVVNKITIVLNTIKYLVQIGIILLWKNYYLYLIVNLVSQLMTNIVTSLIVSKMYPQYKAQGKLDKFEISEINKRIRDLFTAKLGGVIIGPADTVVISAFLGITVLAVYQNYQFIMNSIIGFMTIVFQSCIAGIGNSFVTESEEKNYKDFEKFTFFVMWLITWCTACLYCLYQPFMRIWVGEELMLSNSVVVCICLYFYVFEMNQIFIAYKDAAGIWHEDRFRPLIVSLTNFVLNLILVRYIGIFGVLLSTVISTAAIGMPWLIKNVFTVKFKRSPLPLLHKFVKYSLVAVIAVVVSSLVCRLFEGMNNVVCLILDIMVCCTVPNVICFAFYRNTNDFYALVEILNRIVRKRRIR